MAIMLADVQANIQDHVSALVIDEFRKNSFLLDNMVFDDAVSPTGGGATLTYAYTRVSNQASAASRAINTEYEGQAALKERHVVDLKVFGGAFDIDRVLASTGGVVDEVQFQLQQKVKATQALFSDMVINGDTTENPYGFDGLSKALTGSDTEVTASADLSTSALVTQNYMQFLDELDEMIAKLDGAPSCLLGNSTMMAKVRAVARRAAMYQTDRDDWGNLVEYYGSIPLVDLGAKSGSRDPIIATEDGVSSIYAVRLGLDGFHGVAMNGQSPIRTWLPDFETAGTVKRGEVEMVAAVALKSTRAAAVLRGVKIGAQAAPEGDSQTVA